MVPSAHAGTVTQGVDVGDTVPGMSDLRIDVLMGTSLDDLEGQCRARMATGVDGLFTFEGQHDPFLPLAIAANTVEADLMTNVAIAFPRSPMQLANVAYDLQVLSGGRFKLGLGSQVKPAIEKRFGAQWSQPVPRMREWVLATKAIFAAWEGTAKLDFRGEFTTHTLMTPNFNPGPNPYGPPPVLIGALGPRMTEVAAEVADGVLVMPFNSARHLAENTMPAIERGIGERRTRAGRRRRDLRGDRVRGSHRGGARRRDARGQGVALLLRLDAVVQAGARRRGMG